MSSPTVQTWRDQSEERHRVALAMGGDRAALNELFAPCLPKLRHVTARLLSNRQDSEDALQEGLLLAFRHLNQFQGRARFSTWLHSVVVNVARSKLRRKLSGPQFSSLEDTVDRAKRARIADIVADPRPGADHTYERAEQAAVLSRIVDNLPPRWRLVIRLYDLEGLSIREVALRLGATESAIKTRHHRANRFLDRLLNQSRALGGSSLLSSGFSSSCFRRKTCGEIRARPNPSQGAPGCFLSSRYEYVKTARRNGKQAPAYSPRERSRDSRLADLLQAGVAAKRAGLAEPADQWCHERSISSRVRPFVSGTKR